MTAIITPLFLSLSLSLSDCFAVQSSLFFSIPFSAVRLCRLTLSLRFYLVLLSLSLSLSLSPPLFPSRSPDLLRRQVLASHPAPLPAYRTAAPHEAAPAGTDAQPRAALRPLEENGGAEAETEDCPFLSLSVVHFTSLHQPRLQRRSTAPTAQRQKIVPDSTPKTTLTFCKGERSTVQCSAVQCGTGQCSVQCSTRHAHLLYSTSAAHLITPPPARIPESPRRTKRAS